MADFPAPYVARPQHEGATVVAQRFEQFVVVVDVVLEVGVLDEHEIARGLGEACAHGVAFPTRPVLVHNAH